MSSRGDMDADANSVDRQPCGNLVTGKQPLTQYLRSVPVIAPAVAAECRAIRGHEQSGMPIWGCTHSNASSAFTARVREHFRAARAPGATTVVDEDGAAAAAPIAVAVNGLLVAVHGSPRDRDTPDAPLTAQALAGAYRAQGDAMLERLCGPFALAITDTERRRTFLAVDRMGIGRLAYNHNDSWLIFADRVDLVARSPGMQARLSHQRLYDYLFFHMVPAPESAYDGVHKLEAATCLIWEHGKAWVTRYWQPVFEPDRQRRPEEFTALLHTGLEQAVHNAGPDDRTGAFLSGGLDSSTVAGYLQRVTAAAAPTFSIGFGEPGYDELEYARIANRHFGCAGHEYNVTPKDVLEVFPMIAQAYDEPFGNSSAVPVLLCARLAKAHGMDHLLAGDGGDELFAGNERYAKQKVFEAYQRIPAFLRRTLVEPGAGCINSNSSITPLRKLRSYVDQARIPLPERLETWNYAFREGISTMLHPEFAASIDSNGPMRQMREVYERVAADSVVDRLLAYDWHFTLADSDLRKVSIMCELAGVQVSYPMLDHRLVELAMQIPPEQKLRRLQLRSFYKNAMQDFLPQQILQKPKHGFGLPFGPWLKSNADLAELIYARLQNLKKRQIFREGFIDQLIEEQRSGHASYFGYFVWDLAILEEWFCNQP